MSGKNLGRRDMTSPASPSVDRSRDASLRSERSRSSEADQSPAPTFDAELRDALAGDRISDARTLVANAEAVLTAHDASEASGEKLTRADVAAAKARIAIATGDSAAARAILVQAIEAAPKVTMLRAMMTEVMLANGRATDVRPVLKHLGNKGPERQGTPSTSDKLRSRNTRGD